MTLEAPAWLVRHDGALRPTADGTWAVLFEGGPQYLLIPVPAAGQHACDVVETVNGRWLGSKDVFPSADEALRGGLECLRRHLGW
jgi:hypothetical protein